MKIPRLHLSLGQIAWAINLGEPAPRHLLDRLNYLRQLGIPLNRDQRGAGSGNRVPYDYDDLIECGVALFALENGMKPADVSKVLVGERSHSRKTYRKALKVLPEQALTDPWVKSRGKTVPMIADEVWLRLHNRYSETPGTMEVLGPADGDAPAGASLFDPVERFADGLTFRLVPLTRLAVQWTAWALEAPEIRTGPRT